MRKLRPLCAALLAATLLAPPHAVRAVEGPGGDEATGVPPAAWPTSPFHGVISGATGEPIPCRCRYRDSDHQLGTTICMNTHLGVQLARCDLLPQQHLVGSPRRAVHDEPAQCTGRLTLKGDVRATAYSPIR